MSLVHLSVIIPARNEERLIEQTVHYALLACQHFSNEWIDDDDQRPRTWELMVVDNASTDRTRERLQRYEVHGEIVVVHLDRLGAAGARNEGRLHARGKILVFIDADTMIPHDCLARVAEHCYQREHVAGITSLGQLDGGIRARAWWSFWNHVRRLPLARAKAMPAFMFCTSETFDRFGPFDERVAIGEEWPILAGLYRNCSRNFVYDRTIIVKSSSRRMDYGAFGYTRTLIKYVWAILHYQGRVHYTDTIR